MSPAAPFPAFRRTAGFVALLFSLSSVVSLAHPDTAAAWSGGSFSSTSERQLIALTNRSRAAAGLRSLKIDSALTSIARWRSRDMSRRDYFSHSIPGYGSVFDKLSAEGYCFHLAGENIGWNTYPDDVATAEIHQMFMASSSHRHNILGRTWEAIGVGAYKGSDGKKLWTVLFADKCGGGSPTASRSKPKPVARHAAAVPSKPKPKPRPTAMSRPVPTPTPGPLADRVDPELFAETTTGDGTPSTGADTSASAARPPLTGATGLRVVDRGSSGGLVETIVGGVTGSFFGA
jgi:uncharacterized protein YkwD